MAAQSFIQARLLTRPLSPARVILKVHLNIRADYLIIRLLLSAGLLIPALMVFHFIPGNFLLCGIAFGMLAAGGVGLLVRCGEVA